VLKRYELAHRIPTHHRCVKSAFECCTILRSFWGPTVKHENIGVYCPLDYGMTTQLSKFPTISASTRSNLCDLVSTSGSYPPNFGTQTKQKVSDHGYKITSTSSTFSDIKSLVLTSSELHADHNLEKIIDEIIGSRSPWSLKSLAALLPTSYGGVAAHRHNEITTRLFSVLGSRTVPTHITFCTDNAGSLSGGEADYPLVFQEYFLLMTSVYQALSLSGTKAPRDFGIHIPSPLIPLPDDRVQAPPSNVMWPRYTGNKLCYTDVIQFREIPAVPSPTIAHHISLSDISNRSLIFNCWLSRSDLRNLRLMKPSSIVLPTELLDLKEFNHCPYKDIIAGTAWYIAVMSIYDCARAGAKDSHLFLGDAIRSNSYRISSMLARQCVHKLNANSRTNAASNIRLMPGLLGAQNAASSLSGDLIQRASAVIQSGELLDARDFQFVLFQDSSRRFNSMLLIVCMALIGMTSYDSKKMLIKPYDKMILDSAYTRAESLHPNMLGLTLLNHALQDLLKGKKNGEKILWSTRSLTYYCNTTSKEAIRDFRNRAIDVRLRTDADTGYPPARVSPLDGRVAWSKQSLFGSLFPSHTCDMTTTDDRVLDLFCSGIMRPFGRYASAMSLWTTVLRRYSKRIAGRKVMTIGVGHGATSSVALRSGALHVEGIDLRTSFPMITQREGTYVPPEIMQCGMQSQFSWSDYVFEFGGDITAYPNLVCESRPDIIILDVEIELDDQLPLLYSIPHGTLVFFRVICCEDKAKWIISACNPLRVTNSSTVRSSKKQSWIFVYESPGYDWVGNSNEISLDTVAKFRPKIDRSLKYTTERVNDFIRPSGYEIKEASLAHLSDVRKSLYSDYLNSNSEWIRLQLKLTYEYVDRIILWTRKDPAQLTRNDVLSLSSREARDVSRHLSCVWNDSQTIVDTLLMRRA